MKEGTLVTLRATSFSDEEKDKARVAVLAAAAVAADGWRKKKDRCCRAGVWLEAATAAALWLRLLDHSIRKNSCAPANHCSCCCFSQIGSHGVAAV